MQNSIKQRIKDFCEEIGITVSAFEKRCGLSNGYVNGITKCIGEEKLKSISLNYPQLNIIWLVMGEGQMLQSPINQEINGANNTQVAGNNNHVNTPETLDKALDEVAAQRRLVEKSQQQIDRLLSIIENMNAK